MFKKAPFLFQNVEEIDPATLFTPFLEAGEGHGEKNGFEKRAEKGNRQRQKDDDQQIGHRTPKSSAEGPDRITGTVERGA